jgi:hypothetical protein
MAAEVNLQRLGIQIGQGPTDLQFPLGGVLVVEENTEMAVLQNCAIEGGSLSTLRDPLREIAHHQRVPSPERVNLGQGFPRAVGDEKVPRQRGKGVQFLDWVFITNRRDGLIMLGRWLGGPPGLTLRGTTGCQAKEQHAHKNNKRCVVPSPS